MGWRCSFESVALITGGPDSYLTLRNLLRPEFVRGCRNCCCDGMTQTPNGEREAPRLASLLKNPGTPATAVGGSFKSSLQTKAARSRLRIPPTPVGGIRRRDRAAFVCRLDLNDPPTPVGGIRR